MIRSLILPNGSRVTEETAVLVLIFGTGCFAQSTESNHFGNTSNLESTSSSRLSIDIASRHTLWTSEGRWPPCSSEFIGMKRNWYDRLPKSFMSKTQLR